MSKDQKPTLNREIAHKLRSYINAISLASDLWESGDNSMKAEALAVVKRSAKSLSDYIDQLAGTERNQALHNTPPIVSPASRVLVVEDDYFLAQAVASQLKNADYEIVGPVGSIEDALEALAASLPDCAVVDANLNGRHSTPIILELEALGLPAVILTGYDQTTLPEELQQLPYIQKPVSPQLLQDAVRSMISSRDRTRPQAT